MANSVRSFECCFWPSWLYWALVKIVFCYPEINYFLKALDICFLFIAPSYNLATVQQHSAYLSINLNTTLNSKRRCYAVICWKRSRRLEFPSYCRTMVQQKESICPRLYCWEIRIFFIPRQYAKNVTWKFWN